MITTSNQLSNLENFSLSASLTKSLSNLNESGYFILGTVGSRIIGFVSIPFTALADGGIHSILCAGKMGTGVIFTPYNIIMETAYPKWSAPRDLELSSALIHLMRVVECVFTAAILPFICLITPNRAYHFMNHRYGMDKEAQQARIEHLHKKVNQLNNQVENLSKNITTKTEIENSLNAQLLSFTGSEAAQIQMTKQIAALNQQIKEKTNEIEKLKKGQSKVKETYTSFSQTDFPIIPITSSSLSSTPPPPPKYSSYPKTADSSTLSPTISPQTDDISIPLPPPTPPPPPIFSPVKTSSSLSKKSSTPPPTANQNNFLNAMSSFKFKDQSLETPQVNQKQATDLVDDSKLCQKHKIELKKENVSINLKDNVEEVINYLNEEGGWDLYEQDDQIQELIQDYCSNFRIDLDLVDRKPLNLDPAQLTEIKTYFENFYDQIETKIRIAEAQKTNNSSKKEDLTAHLALIHQKNIEEQTRLLNKKKEVALAQISFLALTNLKKAEETLPPLTRLSLPTIFQIANEKLITDRFATYEEFTRQHPRLVEKIETASNEQDLESIQHSILYQNIYKVTGALDLEIRNRPHHKSIN